MVKVGVGWESLLEKVEGLACQVEGLIRRGRSGKPSGRVMTHLS